MYVYLCSFFLHLQAAIWQALNHYAYRDAVFLAERLYAEGLQKENKSYLVECLISRKAMTILLLSLVIQQIGLPKDQNVTKRALV
uniref:Uncharacterized protein n=1 Tax=Colobus angolensis palliatus TaxID=336983 RepID=A0A2K5JEM0_COLAP